MSSLTISLRRSVACLGAWMLACLLAAPAWAQYALPEAPAPEDDPLFSLESPIGPIDYVTGRGLRLGKTGFTIGGFSTLEIDREEGEAGTIELDSLSFLISWQPFDFLQGFAEISIEDIVTVKTNGDRLRTDPKGVVERAYGDLVYSDALKLRVGKFQTPVGIWNLVPAEPFTWTATEPLLVDTAFDEHQTGVALHGSLFQAARSLDYWVYGQVLDPLHPSSDPDAHDRSVGSRIRYGNALGDWSVGSSFLASERRSEWNFLGGLDGRWRYGPLELQGEFTIVRGEIPKRDLWGIYVQGVYDLEGFSPLLRGLHAVARYEHFDPREDGKRDANLWNLGLTWYPTPFLILKAGYQLSDRQTDDVTRGLFTSISVLF